MKIAVYYPWVHLKSGVEKTIFNTIIGDKHNKYTVFTNRFNKKDTYPEFGKIKVVELKSVSTKRDILSTLKSAITIAFQKVDLNGYDLLVIHSEGLGDLFLLRNHQIPAICYCHTPLRPVFDTEYRSRAYSKLNIFSKIVFSSLSYLYAIVDRKLWKKYKYIIFNSNETYKRAIRGKLITKNISYKIIRPGVEWNKIKPTSIFDKYFLLPGRIMWTKNIELAINAFNMFTKSKNGFKLIIAGMLDAKSKKYYKEVLKMARSNKNIQIIPNPTDTKLKQLYKNCYAVLATAFNEDWGLTPLESGAYGKPIIAVNMGGFKESIINGKTGFLLKADPVVFSKTMDYLVNNPKKLKNIGKIARNHTKNFSWKKFNLQFRSLLKNFEAH